MIFDFDNFEPAVYFVTSGSVLLAEQNPGALRETRRQLNAGSVFGLLTFFDGKPREMRATALGTVETLVLTDVMLERLAAWEPRVALIVVKDLAEAMVTITRQYDRLI